MSNYNLSTYTEGTTLAQVNSTVQFLIVISYAFFFIASMNRLWSRTATTGWCLSNCKIKRLMVIKFLNIYLRSWYDYNSSISRYFERNKRRSLKEKKRSCKKVKCVKAFIWMIIKLANHIMNYSIEKWDI